MAAAQVRWDAGADVGVMQRFVTGAAPGAPSPLPGPVGEVRAHVALVPMLRLGPYLSHEIAFQSAGPAREITAAGLRAKVTPPLLALPWRSWAFVGVGYARAYEPSHALGGELAPGEAGGFLEMRLGVGVGYRTGRNWEVFAELGGRFGLVYAGSLYDPGCGCGETYEGKDSFALALSLGLSLYP
ncbi:MAG TPA: hypothetical protein VK762_07840 [Polyangiaceae bacterium]|nr:hypothetical protein [Polyangiaceae bacterium]